MILICAALRGEWQALQTALNLLSEIEPRLFGERSRNLALLRTGMGPAAAEILNACLKRHPFEQVINAGTAGCLTAQDQPGTLFRIGRVSSAQHDQVFPLAVWPVGDELPVRHLVSVSQPVTNEKQARFLALKYQSGLVDMELWPLARVCREHGLPLSAIKIVSDLANADTERDFKKNYQKLTENLAGWFAARLNQGAAK